MTFSIATPSADDIKKAPRAFGLYRQALSANGSVDAKVRRSFVVQLLPSWVHGFWSSRILGKASSEPRSMA